MTVTATKTRRDPLLTPGEINVVPREEIDRVQAQSLEDVLRYQPGIDVQNGPRRLGELPVIRGLSGARILTTIDGVRLNFQSGHRGRLFLDVDALKQLEVVRGPNSALWGSGALGGVLALTTKDPSDYLEPGASFGFATKFGVQGANREFLGSPTLFGRLLDNRLEYLLTYTTRHAGDIELGGDAGTLPNSAERLHSGLGKLVWSVTPFDQLKLSVQGFDEAGEVPTNPGANTTDPTAVVERQTQQFTYRLGYTHRNAANPWLDLQGFVYYTTLDIRERLLANDQPGDIAFDTLGFELRNSTRLHLAKGHGHVLTYGLEWYRDRQEARRAGGPDTLFPNADVNSLALYIQDEISLWERLFLIPALRWDYLVQNAEGQPEVTEGQVSPKLGGVLKVTDFLYVEANYAEGFRAPNFGELFISGTHFPGAVFVPNPDLKPETSKNVDVGLRLRRDRLLFQHDRFLLRGAYFRNALDDFIDFAVQFNPRTRRLEFRPVNVQEALLEGFEAEMLWAFYAGFELFANYTDITGDNETTDQPLASIPPRKGVIGLSYTFAPRYLTVGGRVQIVDDQKRVPEGVARTPGYTVYDLFANWQPRRGPLLGFRVDFGIDNVTDKEYRRHLAGIPEAGINPKVAISYTRNW
jgi:hemoglobin/transferrin/lactoferrin receptor protein